MIPTRELTVEEKREFLIQKTMAHGKTRVQAEAGLSVIGEAMARHGVGGPVAPRMTDNEFNSAIRCAFLDGSPDE